MDSPPYIKSLNQAQLRAVTHDPSIPLQILAGPGSGKTRVLTSRVAYLVDHHKIAPSRICAVTFTNKAANEMRHRLRPLIGENATNSLVMGTFHAICSKYLRKHATKISLKHNFSICDSDESKRVVSKIFKTKAKDLKAKSIELTDSSVVSCISNAKAKTLSPSDLSVEAEQNDDDAKRIISEIYEEYETALKGNNSLDFDDLLVYGVQLFTKCPDILKSCEHILVDEFQDTSILQYRLVKLFAQSHKCLSIVGDPDQSIYGWRAAEIENLNVMMKDFPTCEQIFLEENYRSTGAILKASHAIVVQDESRIDKGLHTSSGTGSKPVLQTCLHEHDEGDFIADEIKRLIAHTGGMLRWSDFAVLLRNNALSRTLEATFQKHGIPMKMLAGQRFFDRAEIKDILAYLRLIDNPSYDPAFSRIINVPQRSIGEKSVAEIEAIAKNKGWSLLETAEKISQGNVSGKDPRAITRLRKDLPPFLKIIRQLKDKANQGISVPELLKELLALIRYDIYLQRTQLDADSRWENVKELINFAEEICVEPTKGTASQSKVSEFTLNDDGSLTEVVSTDEPDEPETGETPLRTFLQTSSLSTDTENEEGANEKDNSKVTISTCHAAKGLEWPVVFVPAVEKGTFPFFRNEDPKEERRLLYVACTRAQTFLYLTHAESRKSGGETRTRECSEFVTLAMKQNPGIIVSNTLPVITPHIFEVMKDLLKREIPSQADIQEKIGRYRPIVRVRPASNTEGHKVDTQHARTKVAPSQGPSRAGSKQLVKNNSQPTLGSKMQQSSNVFPPTPPPYGVIPSYPPGPMSPFVPAGSDPYAGYSAYPVAFAFASAMTVYQAVPSALPPAPQPSIPSVTVAPTPAVATTSAPASKAKPISRSSGPSALQPSVMSYFRPARHPAISPAGAGLCAERPAPLPAPVAQVQPLTPIGVGVNLAVTQPLKQPTTSEVFEISSQPTCSGSTVSKENQVVATKSSSSPGTSVAGGKRRLGMGSVPDGYGVSSKKAKSS